MRESRSTSRRATSGAIAIVAITAAVLTWVVGSAGPTAATAGSNPVTELVNGVLRTLHPVCAAPAAGHVSCNAVSLAPATSSASHTSATTSSVAIGMTPAQLRSAYKLPSTLGGTVAIVDAYDDPHAAPDLAAYRAHFGLPACSAATGCFRKLTQTGATAGFPAPDAGWASEISLDLDAVSAACPRCKIVLVEARSTSDSDIAIAEDTAARQHPNAIGNSFGGTEDRTEKTLDAAFHHPGIAVTAATGDGGYGVEYPAASPYVTAVGGTTLKPAANARGWTESAWGAAGFLLFPSTSGTGSGCSAIEPKPSWQTDTACSRRTVADVAADADPATGLAVYDTYGESGWLQIGGTSLSTQLVAAVYAMAHDVGNSTGAQRAYSHRQDLFDVTTGRNGSCGTGLLGLGASTYLCRAGVGYDGPTGLGTPNGIGAF